MQTAEASWQSSSSALSWTAAASTPSSDVYLYSHSDGSWEASSQPRLTPESDDTSSLPRYCAAQTSRNSPVATEQRQPMSSDIFLTQAIDRRPNVVQAGATMGQSFPRPRGAQHNISSSRTGRLQQQRHHRLESYDQVSRDSFRPVNCLLSNQAAVNASIEPSSSYMTPSVPSKLKRKRELSPARRAKAKQMRREGPCVRCRMYKEGVCTSYLSL
jgi:hypothetical protein